MTYRRRLFLEHHCQEYYEEECRAARAEKAIHNFDRLRGVKRFTDVRSSHSVEEPLLHIAIGQNDVSKCLQLCKDSTIDVNQHDSIQNYPLHNAIKNVEIVQILCKQKCIQINALNIHGRSALHCAVMQRCYDTVEYLCNMRECDVNIIDVNGNTPLMLAMLLQEYNEFATKYLKIVKCLLGRSDIDVNAGGATEKPIHIVCRMKNIDGLRLLLANPRIQVNAQDSKSRTPLMIAISKDHGPCLSLLLECGAVMSVSAPWVAKKTVCHTVTHTHTHTHRLRSVRDHHQLIPTLTNKNV